MRGRLKLRYNIIVLGSRFSSGSRLRLPGRLVEYISHVHAIRWKQALRESSYMKRDERTPSLFYFPSSTSRRRTSLGSLCSGQESAPEVEKVIARAIYYNRDGWNQFPHYKSENYRVQNINNTTKGIERWLTHSFQFSLK